LGVWLSAPGGERLHVNAPKGKLPKDVRAQIAERKAEILAFLRRKSSTTPVPPIRRRAARGEPAPLSFAQERLSFLAQLEPQSTAYNICRASRLLGNLSSPVLEASLKEVVSRHETLRTALRLVDGKPVQLIRPAEGISIDFVDLRSVQESKRTSSIQRQIETEALCPFNLESGALLRCALLRVSEQEHILVLTTHHSAADAWSMGTLTRELWTLYDAFRNGRPCPLEPLPVQYSDYAVWQRDWLQGNVLESQLDYWKERLKDLPVLNLPTDRLRKPRQSFDGARVAVELSNELTSAVKEMSHRFAVTPFMALLAAFQVLLYRYTGQEDVVVGFPIANRRRPEVEGLIGFFVNTLVLRADLSGKPSFSELLFRVRDLCLGADANQDLPFEKLVQELQPERDQSRNPLFQVMFVLQNATRPFTGIPGLRIEPVEVTTSGSPFELSLFLRERKGKFIGHIEYSTDLFDRDRIDRMAGHYRTLLQAIVSDPDQFIATLPILTEAERHQILVEWNDTAADYPKDRCIHELFQEQVERTPEAIAVEFENQQITYRELNRRANQLASHLITLGIGPEKPVGIYVERSIEMVVGLLGILKAGGAYLALDPNYPKQRLHFMVEDSQVSVLLYQRHLLPKLPQTRALAACLEELILLNGVKPANPKTEVTPDSAAYVIYTSGSTGKPKGIIGLHRGSVNRFSWMWRAFPFNAREVSCIKTSLSFVDSVWEIFGPLLQGVTSIIIPEQVVRDSRLLTQALAKYRITRIVLVPSLLRAILETSANLQTKLPKLKLWSTSGEPLRIETRERFRKLLPQSTLVNLYGSSEVSADITFAVASNPISANRISIGHPISNTQIYLLDSLLQPVPIGVPGEVYVGGKGLARGYLNRPELTSERFIQSPFDHGGGSRLYRTGDLALHLPDGNIEFLGRVDNQVKIRGYRIEPAEVEAVLNEHPAVYESVVIAWDDGEVRHGSADYSKRLIAYIVASAQSPCCDELRKFLMKRLPDYMVPSVFIMLDHLPVTPNGKVNRQALPPPEAAKQPLDQSLIEPRTEFETLVAKVWRDVLKIERLGIHDNFFELGGHSFLGTQVVARLSDVFCKQIPLHALFDAPTVAQFAFKIERIVQGRRSRELPPVAPVLRDKCLPASLAQQQFWLVDELLPGTELLNMPYAYRIIGSLDATVLHKSLQAVVNRHEALRTIFAEVDGRLVQIVDRRPRIKFRFIDLSYLSASSREQRATQLSRRDASGPFNLETGPLLRTKLIRLTKSDHILLVTMHHIIGDQWSIGVFRRDLAALYKAFVCGRPSPLPELSIQFADFVCWQQQVLRRGLLRNQIAYWEKRLAGTVPILQFQKNRRKKRSVDFRTSRRLFEFDPAFFTQIAALARQESSTSFMIILTAINILLHHSTGQRDIRIGTLAANRNLKGTEKLIGYFVNTVIVRTQMSPDWTFRQLLKRVQKNALEAFAHQDIPIEELESALETKRKAAQQPLFQVLLNYRNLVFQSGDDSGLIFAPWNGKNRLPHAGITMTTLDLIIELRETSTKLTGAVIYKTKIFSERLITQMIDNFHIVLARVNLQSDCLVSNIFDR
jgi:amino acid adenylation domain-containing protein